MSANNYLLIRENDSGEYHVEERDAETQDLIESVGIFLHSLDALHAAQNHQEENEVEYGIQFSPRTP